MNEEAQNKHENKGNTEIHENHVERKQASGYEQEAKKRETSKLSIQKSFSTEEENFHFICQTLTFSIARVCECAYFPLDYFSPSSQCVRLNE